MSLPNKRWADTVKKTIESLLQSADSFCASHLCDVIYSLTNRRTAVIPVTERVIVEWIQKCIAKAPIEELCKTYKLISEQCTGKRHTLYSADEVHVVEGWRRWCEDKFVLKSGYVALADCEELSDELQCVLREEGCLRKPVFTSNNVLVRLTRTMPACSSTLSQSIDLSRMYRTFVPYLNNPIVSMESTHSDRPRKSHKEVAIKKLIQSKPQVIVRSTRAQLIRQEHNKGTSKQKSATSITAQKQKQVEVKEKSSSTSLLTGGAKNFLTATAAPKLVASTSTSLKTLKEKGTETRPTLVITDHKGSKVTPRKPPPTAVNSARKPIQKANPTAKSSSAAALLKTNSGEAPKQKAAVSKIPVFISPKKVTVTSKSEPSLARAAKMANAAASGKRLPEKRGRSAGGRLSSLMQPTASSSAKMVTKKATTSSRASATSPTTLGENASSPIPRSNTFVKDKRCFPASPDISES